METKGRVTQLNTLRTRITLLQRIRDQFDEKSWNEFLEFYDNYIYNVLRSLNINQEMSQELLQQVRIKLWEKLPDLDATNLTGKFRSWLYSVVINHARDHFRKDKTYREKLHDFDQLLQQSGDVDIDEVVERAEIEWRQYLFSLAWKTVEQKFKAEACQCFERLSNGDSAKEVADSLKLNINTVYTNKRRILELLHEEINRLELEKG